MKFIVNVQTNQDTCHVTYVVNRLEEIGYVLQQYTSDYCEGYQRCPVLDVQVIPAEELRKEVKLYESYSGEEKHG